MEKIIKLTRTFTFFLFLVFFMAAIPYQTQAASTLNINLKNNQTFYLLPGTDKLNYKVTVTSKNISGNQICTSSNLSVADIDDMGNMTINDAGSTKITVSLGNKKVTRTINVLRRTDWTKVIAIKNRTKLAVKNNMCSMTISNQMDFPIKTTLHYSTIADSGSTITPDVKTSDIYLPAGKSLNYKMMVPDGITMVSINGADFVYNQFGLEKIDTKKISIKESTSKKDANTKTITETITNKNKNGLILPYHIYLYDQNNQLISVEYRFAGIAGKQKTTIDYIYTTKEKYLDSYVAKVKYKFETPVPFF